MNSKWLQNHMGGGGGKGSRLHYWGHNFRGKIIKEKQRPLLQPYINNVTFTLCLRHFVSFKIYVHERIFGWGPQIIKIVIKTIKDFLKSFQASIFHLIHWLLSSLKHPLGTNCAYGKFPSRNTCPFQRGWGSCPFFFPKSTQNNGQVWSSLHLSLSSLDGSSYNFSIFSKREAYLKICVPWTFPNQ